MSRPRTGAASTRPLWPSVGHAGAQFRPPAPSALERVLGVARPAVNFFDALFRAWGANRLAREMEQWPDERLKDVGLTRAEVASRIEGLRRPFRWHPDADTIRMHDSRFGH